MTSTYKAMIFDMDGTLIDSMYAWRGVFREFLDKYELQTPAELVGVPEYPVGWTAKLVADQLAKLPEPMTVGEAVEEMYRMVGAHYATGTLARPGAIEFIERLKEHGYIVAIATATPLRYADIALKRLGFDGMFDLVVSNDEIGMGKQDERYFGWVADKLGVKMEECVIFEDAVYSIRAAKKAGFKVCAIEDYYAWRDKEEILSLADRYIACYADLLEENWD